MVKPADRVDHPSHAWVAAAKRISIVASLAGGTTPSTAGQALSNAILQRYLFISLTQQFPFLLLRSVVFQKWPCVKYPITKSGHRKEVGGGVWTHAGFSKIQHKYVENKTFRTFYKIFLACRGGSPLHAGLKIL